MRKTVLLALIVIIIMIFTPSVVDHGGLLSKGGATPSLVVGNGDSTVNLKSLKGRYVLVDFWSSADAKSRLNSNQYNTLNWGGGSHDPTRVSVNLDPSERLFHEIVARDHMDESTQYHVEGADATKIIKDFDLTDGYKSYLINPEGKVVAVNPDAEYLKENLNL